MNDLERINIDRGQWGAFARWVVAEKGGYTLLHTVCDPPIAKVMMVGAVVGTAMYGWDTSNSGLPDELFTEFKVNLKLWKEWMLTKVQP